MVNKVQRLILGSFLLLSIAYVYTIKANVSHPVVITETMLITPNSQPMGITVGPDASLWFTQSTGNKIGKITPAGIVTEYTLPSSNSGPTGIAAGPDGTLWFTENKGHRIGAITSTGIITEYITGISPDSGPMGITAGPDGNLWFAEWDGNRIGKVAPDGGITEYSVGITPNSGPVGIALGQDGNLWFTEYDGDRIGKITAAGTITEYITGLTPGSGPFGITAGPDGNMWFTEFKSSRIGKITPSGGITEYSTGITPHSGPVDITLGQDGNLWFTQLHGNSIGKITPEGVITEYSAGITPNSGPTGIAMGQDGNLWFTERFAHQIGKIRTDTSSVLPVTEIVPVHLNQNPAPVTPAHVLIAAPEHNAALATIAGPSALQQSVVFPDSFGAPVSPSALVTQTVHSTGPITHSTAITPPTPSKLKVILCGPKCRVSTTCNPRISGRATPGATVYLTANNRLVGKTQASNNGCFCVKPRKALCKGCNTIVATAKNGNEIARSNVLKVLVR